MSFNSKQINEFMKYLPKNYTSKKADSNLFDNDTYLIVSEGSSHNNWVAITFTLNKGRIRFTITYCDDYGKPAISDKEWPMGTVRTTSITGAAALVKAAFSLF